MPDIDLPPINLDRLEVPRRKESGRFNRPHTIEDVRLKDFVKRTIAFNSVGHPSFDSNGMLAVADTKSLTITSTIESRNGATLLIIPEVSFYIDQVAASNEYPVGNIFNESTAKLSDENYNLTIFQKTEGATNDTIKLVSRLTNSTGGSVNMGVKVYIRYIINVA